MFCKYCGKEIDDDSDFCCHCGNPLHGQTNSKKEAAIIVDENDTHLKFKIISDNTIAVKQHNVSSEYPLYTTVDGVLYNKAKDTIIRVPTDFEGPFKISSNIKCIERSAFSDCSNITSIEIPSGITCIKESTFCSCSNLENINIPNSVSSIGENAFCNCVNLQSIKLPDSLTKIGEGAFTGSGLETIDIPESVSSIEERVFYGCTDLRAINISKNVKSIEGTAFSYCKKLNNIYLDPENKDFVLEEGVLYNKSKTEIIRVPVGKTGNFVIPSTVSIIGDYAFDGCTNLTGIEIPDSVKKIGYNAFTNCHKLTSIKLPSNLTSIEDDTFAGCKSLRSIEIPSNVTRIGSSAFYDCSALNRIIIPSKVKSIGIWAFANGGRMEVLIDNSEFNVSVDKYSFQGCKSVTYLR